MLADGQVGAHHGRADRGSGAGAPPSRLASGVGDGQSGTSEPPAASRGAPTPLSRLLHPLALQLTLGDKVLKHTGRKIRRLALGALGGFAGGQAEGLAGARARSPSWLAESCTARPGLCNGIGVPGMEGQPGPIATGPAQSHCKQPTCCLWRRLPNNRTCGTQAALRTA
jgi:hypothetical protein